MIARTVIKVNNATTPKYLKKMDKLLALIPPQDK